MKARIVRYWERNVHVCEWQENLVIQRVVAETTRYIDIFDASASRGNAIANYASWRILVWLPYKWASRNRRLSKVSGNLHTIFGLRPHCA